MFDGMDQMGERRRGIRLVPPNEATQEVKDAAARAGVVSLGARGELHVFRAPKGITESALQHAAETLHAVADGLTFVLLRHGWEWEIVSEEQPQ